MYHALVPEKNVKALKREYRLRLFIVLAFFVSLAVAFGAVCLFPSYIFSSLNEEAALARKAAQDRSAASSTDALGRELAAAGALASSMSASLDGAPLSEAVERAAAFRSPGISIFSVNVTRTGPAEAKMSLSGHADTRDQLVAFEKALEGDAAFSGVSAPISDLAKGADISFSIDLSAKLP